MVLKHTFFLFYRFLTVTSNKYQWNRATIKTLDTFAHERIHKIHTDCLKITTIIESTKLRSLITTIIAFAKEYHYSRVPQTFTSNHRNNRVPPQNFPKNCQYKKVPSNFCHHSPICTNIKKTAKKMAINHHHLL